jgi:hypothetical protein
MKMMQKRVREGVSPAARWAVGQVIFGEQRASFNMASLLAQAYVGLTLGNTALVLCLRLDDGQGFIIGVLDSQKRPQAMASYCIAIARIWQCHCVKLREIACVISCCWLC